MKYARTYSFLLCGCYMYNYWGERKDTGLCEPIWSIRLKCQSMTKLEMKRILQTQVPDCISTKNETRV